MGVPRRPCVAPARRCHDRTSPATRSQHRDVLPDDRPGRAAVAGRRIRSVDPRGRGQDSGHSTRIRRHDERSGRRRPGGDGSEPAARRLGALRSRRRLRPIRGSCGGGRTARSDVSPTLNDEFRAGVELAEPQRFTIDHDGVDGRGMGLPAAWRGAGTDAPQHPWWPGDPVRLRVLRRVPGVRRCRLRHCGNQPSRVERLWGRPRTRRRRQMARRDAARSRRRPRRRRCRRCGCATPGHPERRDHGRIVRGLDDGPGDRRRASLPVGGRRERPLLLDVLCGHLRHRNVVRQGLRGSRRTRGPGPPLAVGAPRPRDLPSPHRRW